MPVSELLSSLSTSNAEQLPSAAGTVPVSEFSSSLSSSNAEQLPSAAGMVPVSGPPVYGPPSLRSISVHEHVPDGS